MSLSAQILAQCYTKTQALRLLEEWEDMVRGNLFGGKDNKLPVESLTQKNYKEEFDKARKEISLIEPLYIYVPRELTDNDLKKIVAKLPKGFLVEIKFQGDLVGGCALSYKGVYKDYSLKKKIQDFRGEILNLKF
jgi:hypothetical protein